MKQIILLILNILLFLNTINAQVSIKGKLTNEAGIPLIGASVLLGSEKGTVTDVNGKYVLENVPNGMCKLRVYYMGYENQTRSTTVSGLEDITEDFILISLVEELQEVEITGRKEKGYKNTSSFIATKSATRLMDVPQSVGYVTKEVVLDQGAFTINDVVKNISGVNLHSHFDDLVIRGHRATVGRKSSILLNGMRVMTSFWKQQLIPHIERVEVLKGPASALFGNASPGGVVNSVTKKPLFESKQSINATAGSFNTLRLLLDFTGSMTKDKKLLYRLNLGHEKSDGFRDLQFSKNTIFAPSFSFIPSHKTRLNFDVVYQNSKGRVDRGQTVFGNGDLYSVPITKSLSAANDYLNEEDLNVTISLQHKFTKNLSINSMYLNSSYDEAALEHRTAFGYVALGDGTLDETKVAMMVFDRKRYRNNQNFSNYLNYNFKIGKTSNNLLIGYDYFQQELEPGGYYNSARPYLLKDGTSTGRFNVIEKSKYVLDDNGNPKANIAHFDLNSPTANTKRDMRNYVYKESPLRPYKQTNNGIYIQNQFAYKRLQLLLGLRKDYFTDFLNYNTEKEEKVRQEAFIPRVGAVYKVTPNINLYGTWVRGYEPQRATKINNPDAGGPFNPLESELLEFGFKSEWFQKKLDITLAIYDLTQKGALYSANDPDNPQRLIQIGEEKSKGIELDAYGKLQDNWSLIFNYAYNHAYVSKADKSTLLKYGDRKSGAPMHTFNMWTKYLINRGKLNGLGFGLGYNYVGERIGFVTDQSVPIFPSYGLVNAALYYNVDKIRIQLNFNNVFNKIHWVGGYDYTRAFPGRPRNIMVTTSYTF